MNRRIDNTEFDSITIAGRRIEHDVLIRLDGRVEKRKIKLSKAGYVTSHAISLTVAEYVFEHGIELLIVGSGQSGMVELSDEAKANFAKKHFRGELAFILDTIQHINKVQMTCDRAVSCYLLTVRANLP